MKKTIIAICFIFFIQNSYADMCSTFEINDLGVTTNIEQFAAEYYKSNSIKFRCLIGLKDWYIAEIESKYFEPVIFVMEKSKKGYDVKAEWGGITEEGDLNMIISDHFMQKAPEIPKNLLDCFVPKGPPFIKKGRVVEGDIKSGCTNR
jgi:hypothetical protein